MTRVARVLALATQLAAAVVMSAIGGSVLACSKFADSGGEPADAGDTADTAPPAADAGGVTTPRRIYFYGGYTTTPAAESRPGAYVSTVGSDGEPGPWTRVAGLDDDRYGGAWIQSGGNLFAFGGTVVGHGNAKDGARAMLGTQPVGAAPLWSPTAQMATGREFASLFLRGTDVYVTGGRNSGLALGNVERYAPGTDKVFAAGPMPALAGHTALLHGSWMYVIGGDRLGTDGPTASVMRAPFDTDGSLLKFENAGALPAVVAYHAFAVVDAYVYIIGGVSTSGPGRAVMRGTFIGDMLTTDVIAPLPTPGQKGLLEPCAVVIDHTIYVMGGRDLSTDPSKGEVYIGQVGDGGVVSWRQAMNSLPEGRAAFGCAVGP